MGGKRTSYKKAVKKYNDENYALKTTIGQGKITIAKNGDVIIKDKYNFNDAKFKTTIGSLYADIKAIKKTKTTQ